LVEPLRQECYSDLGQNGIEIKKGLKALLVQFWEDYSDRQMEKCLKENIAVRWFCEFGLTEETPDYSYFSKLRKRLGVERIKNLFNEVNIILNSQGLFGNVFTFIDASTIISKTSLWEERDQALKDGEEKLNNLVVSKYAADKEAKWGAKSKRNIWFGYRRHQAVDMRHGLIKNLMATPANILDFQAIDEVCPNQGMVFCDKLYDCEYANQIIQEHNCHNGTIRKNNNPEKNKDLDSWRSKIRMPFEGTFSKLSKRARYKGLKKTNIQCYLQAICYNLKKAIRFLPFEAAPVGA
jgi:IS5 family transposase